MGPSGSSDASALLYSPGDFSTNSSTAVIFMPITSLQSTPSATTYSVCPLSGRALRCIMTTYPLRCARISSGRRAVIGEIMQSADQVALRDLRHPDRPPAPRHRRAGRARNSPSWSAFTSSGSGEPAGRISRISPSSMAVMPQHVQRSFVGVADAETAGGLTAAELAA